MSSSLLTLISHHLCPFVQRAAIVLNEKGVAFERVNVDLAAKPNWFLAISPMGKVPLLKIDRQGSDDVVLFESMVICEYLEDSQRGDKLHPTDPLERAQHRAWIEYGSAALADAWGFLNSKDEATAEAKRSAFRDKLQRLDGVLSAGPYFAGPTFSMVDAVFAPIFRYFDVLPQDVGADLFDGMQHVVAWRKALGARPSVVAAVGSDYGARFQEYLRLQGALRAARG
jgi:glutathione S-transferase